MQMFEHRQGNGPLSPLRDSGKDNFPQLGEQGSRET